MTVQDSSLLAYEEIKNKLQNYQAAVLNILEEIGPTHDLRILEALNQKEKTKPKRKRRIWHINEVTARRNELVLLSIVIDIGPHRGFWRREKKVYHIWRVAGDKRLPSGWTKADIKINMPRSPEQIKKQSDNYKEIRQQAASEISANINASRAGQILAEHRIRKSRKRETKEKLLFA